jgi:hypothetical protein
MTKRPQIRLRPTLVVAALALAGLALAACGGASSSSTASSPASAPADTNTSGDIPDTQSYVAFVPASGSYSVKVPEGWSRTATGSSATFTKNFDSIRLETQPASQAPTIASATSTEVPALRSGTPTFALRDVTSVRRSAGDAVLIRYSAQSAADPVTGRSVKLDVERYEFWRAGVQSTLTLADPAGSDNTDPWHTVTDSFSWR